MIQRVKSLVPAPKDGITISMSPTSVILEQVLSGSSSSVDLSMAKTTITAKRGSNSLSLSISGAVLKYINESGEEDTVPGRVDVSGNTVYVNDSSLVKKRNSSEFWPEQMIDFTVTAGGLSFSMRFNIYVHNAGSLKLTVTQEVFNIVATKTGYSLDGSQTMKSQIDAEISASATRLTSQFTEQISRAGATGANLFGFHKDVVFDTYAVPFIQGYGFVCNNHWNAQDKTGRIWNLGMHGRLGYYTVRCLVKTSNSSGYVRLQMNWHDAVAGTQVSAGIKGVVYATTSEWRELTATFLFNDKNESHIGTTVPEGQSGSYEIGDINGYIDIGQIAGSNNGTRISVPNNRIYVRHLKVEYKDIATDFGEADEDVAYLGQGNVAKNLDFRPYRTEDAENQTVDGRNGVYRIRVPYLTNTYPWGDTTNSFRDYLVKSDFFNLEAGKCYTLSFWAKSSVNGFIITQHLYKGNYSIINSIGNDIYVDPSNGTIQESIMSDGQTQVKLSTTWTQYFVHFYVANNVPLANVIPLRVQKSYNNSSARNLAYIYMSDIELQEGYVTPTDYFASFINQNARRISLVQQSGTKLAGVDIQNGMVNLMGDRVIFSNSTGTVSGKVWIDPDNGTIHATDGKFTGEITATGGSITGYLDVTGELDVKNSGGSTVVKVNGSDVSKTSSNEITIIDAEGFYVKRRSEGFRLTTDGFQRWNSSVNNGYGGWVNFYGGRYVRTITLTSTSTTAYNVSVNDDFIIAKPSVANAVLNLPSSNIPDGKILAVVNAGGAGIHIKAGSLKIQGASEWDQVTLNINDRMEFIYSESSNKWYANYMPKVDNV